ncbi:uncharacterized protein [Asterias amurensis]|uniref:uncharacterized protein n=1 Tax=Asterias amurensis TaxID=7602 RepID=UPI003AB1BF4F
MELMVSGLVVTHSGGMRGSGGGLLAMMEPIKPNSLQEQKVLKSEIKRDKNRESSARSRQRKKEEDAHNQNEIIRLQIANEELRRREEMLLQEGRDILSQVDPSYYDNPRCSGCPDEVVETEPCDVPSPPHLSAPQTPPDFMEPS